MSLLIVSKKNDIDSWSILNEFPNTESPEDKDAIRTINAWHDYFRGSRTIRLAIGSRDKLNEIQVL